MLDSLLQDQKKYFESGITQTYEFRMMQLENLKKSIEDHEAEILEALHHDLRKPAFEGYATEVGFVLQSIRHTMKELKSWMKTQTVKTPLYQAGAKSKVHPVPYGVVLVIAPFNYPFQLAMEPLIGAIAAGNTVILKPSEYTVNTEAVLEKVIAQAFDPQYVTTVTGGKEVVTRLIYMPFDYIFFTGSVAVGRVVMKAASERLTPLTLELGGKSPAIVHEDANLDIAAKRITWGKMMNAGQTCVAPDYVYVHEDCKDQLIEKICQNILEFYGDKAQDSPDFCRIVNERHYERLVQLLDSGKTVCGGEHDREDLYIAPTLLTEVTWDDEVMKDEIFGPILPILTYQNISEVVEGVKHSAKPLALYIFSESETVQNFLTYQIPFGGGCINDTISHVSSPFMPFGGVGSSGLGAYHGKYSFETFSHFKSILSKSTQWDLPLVYPPYKNRVNWIKKILK